MADSNTTNYSFVKPENGASDDSWGVKINSNWDSLDTALKAVSDAASGALPKAGGTATGKIIFAASATGAASFQVPHGAAPTSPGNGDVWTTTAGLFVRINGTTKQGAFVGDAVDATALTGTVPAANLPNPTSSTLGGVQSLASASHQFLTSIGTDGIPTKAQPAAGDISGLGSIATANITVSSSAPSGGSDGDIWFQT